MIPMTNEFAGYIVRRHCRKTVLERENHINNYAFRILPGFATISTHFPYPKTHPSWV
jgi:hypothetical protein